MEKYLIKRTLELEQGWKDLVLKSYGKITCWDKVEVVKDRKPRART